MSAPELRTIPAATFRMGYDGDDAAKRASYPPHDVTLDAYAIGRAPVTNDEFAEFVADEEYLTDAEAAGKSFVPEQSNSVPGACWKLPGGRGTSIRGRGDHPVVHVSWQDAVAYCAWLATKHGRAFRLPTEAEWEHAARGPRNDPFPTGQDWDPTLQNLVESGRGQIVRSTDFPPNAFDLLDMGGNVLQWCHDWHDRDYYATSPAKNPRGPEAGTKRVCRGASFAAWRGWAIARLSNLPYYASSDLGFRVAADA